MNHCVFVFLPKERKRCRKTWKKKCYQNSVFSKNTPVQWAFLDCQQVHHPMVKQSHVNQGERDHLRCWACKEAWARWHGDTGLSSQPWGSWGKRVLKPRPTSAIDPGLHSGTLWKERQVKKRGVWRRGCDQGREKWGEPSVVRVPVMLGLGG